MDTTSVVVRGVTIRVSPDKAEVLVTPIRVAAIFPNFAAASKAVIEALEKN